MAVPYTFGSATTSIPLSQLDSNFATTITLGNTAIQLGNTVTTLNNMTLANVTISSGTSNLATTAITNGTSNVTIASSGGNISMATNGTTAVTIDTSQNVGIGTASPSYRIDAVGTGTASTGILRTSSNLTNSTIKYGYYTVGHYTNATAPFGFIQGESNSTENNVHIGGGAGEVTAATRIDFYTAANNSTTSGTERMRIDSSGVVMVGKTTSNNTSNGFQLQASGQELSVNRNLDRCGLFGRNGNDGDIIIFLRDGTTKGSVSVSGANVSYNTSSDYRLKENIAPMDGALAKVAQLKPVTYKWKQDGLNGEGFIAHELAEVCPQAVHGTKDEVDADGNPKYQGIDVSFLVATLTAAIQELKAINDTQAETINALTARIVALESK